jgi:hypothetical protein
MRLRARPPLNAFVRGLTESLCRVVDSAAGGVSGGRVRERVALELAVLARRKQAPLEQYKLARQLDRIAGTKVL